MGIARCCVKKTSVSWVARVRTLCIGMHSDLRCCHCHHHASCAHLCALTNMASMRRSIQWLASLADPRSLRSPSPAKSSLRSLRSPAKSSLRSPTRRAELAAARRQKARFARKTSPLARRDGSAPPRPRRLQTVSESFALTQPEGFGIVQVCGL